MAIIIDSTDKPIEEFEILDSLKKIERSVGTFSSAKSVEKHPLKEKIQESEVLQNQGHEK